MKSYQETLEEIHSMPRFSDKPALSRIGKILEYLENPQKDLKFIHVAGTNGKGSVCVMLESVLRNSGLKTGLFISPYVCRFEERIQINGKPVEEKIFLQSWERVSKIIKDAAALTRDTDGLAAAKFVVFCNSVNDNPFMAGAYCGYGEPECALNIGVSGPGVVRAAISDLDKNADFGVLANKIKQTAYKITTTGELVGRKLADRLGIPFGVIDLSLAPTPAVGDSVAQIFQAMGLEHAGAHGTTAALAMLNDAVKKGGIMASSYVGGLSGAFIPVSEDAGMIEAASKGYLTFDKLEAMTCVCSVGLDMIAIPGDTPESTIAGMIADEMAIGMINKKTTAVRIIPAPNKRAGDNVVFGGLLGEAPVMKVNNLSSENFVKRGGRIPAPIHSLNN